MANPIYADTILIGTSWQQIWPLANAPKSPAKGMLLRVPANYNGSSNTFTALFATSSSPTFGVDIAKGDSGTVSETTIFTEVLQSVDSQVWVKGSNASTPLSIVVE